MATRCGEDGEPVGGSARARAAGGGDVPIGKLRNSCARAAIFCGNVTSVGASVQRAGSWTLSGAAAGIPVDNAQYPLVALSLRSMGDDSQFIKCRSFHSRRGAMLHGPFTRDPRVFEYSCLHR
ncbi:unnamed protein product [Pieris brassicae]|uniref:Uncharacterized protein n=1 Tax=Pieris brassicae TaxID=7116 RepID=A0A9P0TMW6_PIEBR|nr:unnamed protein product [Pieris brassicae]